MGFSRQECWSGDVYIYIYIYIGSKAMVLRSKAKMTDTCDGTSWDCGLLQGRRASGRLTAGFEFAKGGFVEGLSKWDFALDWMLLRRGSSPLGVLVTLMA